MISNPSRDQGVVSVNLPSRSALRLKKPIPRRRVLAKFVGATKLFPRQLHFGNPNATKTRATQPIAHLERLPEMLFQSPVAKRAEGKVVVFVFGVISRVLPCFFRWHPRQASTIQQQHCEVMNSIHRGHDANEMSSGV